MNYGEASLGEATAKELLRWGREDSPGGVVVEVRSYGARPLRKSRI